MAVVDLLETVEIEVKQGKADTGPCRLLQGLPEARHERNAIHKAGNGIVLGQAANFLLQGLLLTGITGDEHKILERTGPIKERRHLGGVPKPPPILMADAIFHAVIGTGHLEKSQQELAIAGQILGVDILADIAVHHLAGLVTEISLPVWRHVAEPPLSVHRGDDITGIFHQLPIAQLTQTQGFFQQFPFGDIVEVAGKQDSAITKFLRNVMGGDPQNTVILAPYPKLAIPTLEYGGAFHALLDDAIVIIGMNTAQ